MIASLCWVPVNAHAPFKGGTIFKPFSVTIRFRVGGQKPFKNATCGSRSFENRGKISPFSDKNRYLWTGP